MAVATETVPKLHADDVAAIDELRSVFDRLQAELAEIIVGQKSVIEQLAICLFCAGTRS